MNLKQLTQKIEEAIDTSNKAYDEMVDAEYNIDDAESYLSSCRDQVSDAKVTLNDATDELRQIIMDIETLEGFDVDKVKREAFEEIGGAIRDLVAQHIDKVVAQAVSAYEETTETDNQ